MDTLPKAPQKSPRFSNYTRYSRWWSSRSTKPDTKNIEALLSAVNSSSQHVRNFYVTFLLAGLYIAIIIWSTTDMMLLKETPVNLPLLNAELPITGFYTFAPYFYLLIHFNLLLQLCLLSDKLHGYNTALSKLQDNKAREYYEMRLFPFAFSHTLSGTQHSGILKFLLTTMVWITMIWLPLCLLIGLQVGFLPYHSEQVLQWQRWAIVADLCILTLFWPIIRSPDGKWMTWVLRTTGISLVLSWINRQFFSNTVDKQQGFLQALVQRLNTRSSGKPMFEGILSLITLIVVIGFSWGVAVLPDSVNEKQIAKWVSMTAGWLDDQIYVNAGQNHADRNEITPVKFIDAWLSVQPLKDDGKVKVAGEIKADCEIKVDCLHYFRLTEWLFDRKYLPLKDDEDNIQQDKWDTDQPRDSIFHRNLRLREKLLIANELKPEDIAALIYDDKITREKVDDFEKERKRAINKTVGLILRGRDLRYADFTGSLMPNIDFQTAFGKVDSKKDEKKGDDSRKVNGVPTDLSYANFDRAKLFNARMKDAKLQGADLGYVQLQGADLAGADLQGADLGYVQLQGADLRSAKLQGAFLVGADLQGANLKWAKLQGANLKWAKLQGTDLGGADLQGTDLGGADLQGAFLRHADLQGAFLRYADLQGADLAGADLQGADLAGADFQGADLRGADLQGADLRSAKLQGAALVGAALQGADLRSAKLQGADLRSAKLQGADLGGADLQGADLRSAELKLSNLTRAKFGKMSEQNSKDLYEEMSQIIKDPEQLKILKDRLSKATKTTTNLGKAKGQNIWLENPDKIAQTAFKEYGGPLEIAKSESDYQNGLADLFIKLSCQDKWAASGIIRSRVTRKQFWSKLPSFKLKSKFAQCLLSLKDKKIKFGLTVCPGMSEISNKEIERLKQMASKAEPEDNIQSTFKCEM